MPNVAAYTALDVVIAKPFYVSGGLRRLTDTQAFSLGNKFS